MSKDKSRTPIVAAGAVLWRPGAKGAEHPEVALIHRAHYNDWSLPKGKVDSGETEPVAAVREIVEETGFHARLGLRLPMVRYRVDDRPKTVYYWAARALDGAFTPSAEVERLRWLPAADAIDKLDYAQDRKVLRRFMKFPADTHTVLVVRHATAGRRSRYRGDDRKRPLDRHGRAQAESLVPMLLAFGATRLHAADRVRCQQTVEPLAQELDTQIQTETTLTEEAYASDPAAGRSRVLEIAAKPGVRVICSQGKVIPDLIDWWCGTSGVKPGKSRNRKGSVWVVSLAGDTVLAADHMCSPLARH